MAWVGTTSQRRSWAASETLKAVYGDLIDTQAASCQIAMVQVIGCMTHNTSRDHTEMQ